MNTVYLKVEQPAHSHAKVTRFSWTTHTSKWEVGFRETLTEGSRPTYPLSTQGYIVCLIGKMTLKSLICCPVVRYENRNLLIKWYTRIVLIYLAYAPNTKFVCNKRQKQVFPYYQEMRYLSDVLYIKHRISIQSVSWSILYYIQGSDY